MILRINRHKGWILLGITSVIVSTIALTAMDIYWYGNSPISSRADAAIVLGAEVWDHQPSPVFRERLNHAINLYKRGQIQAIIFTGGFGVGKKSAEADVGRNYAIANGVEAVYTFTETQSRTTFQNLKFAQPIVKQQQFQKVLIVSDPIHLKRAVTMAKHLGIDAEPSATPTTRYRSLNSQIQFLVREVYFYFVYLLLKI